jgi:hypothetical protein
MLAIILAAIWFGYRAKRVDRNPIGWAFLGILTFLILKVIVNLVAVNPVPSSESERLTLMVILNIVLFGGTFLAGLLIPPVQRGIPRSAPRGNSQRLPEQVATESQEITCPNCKQSETVLKTNLCLPDSYTRFDAKVGQSSVGIRTVVLQCRGCGKAFALEPPQ